jgi:hypothetical protein
LGDAVSLAAAHSSPAQRHDAEVPHPTGGTVSRGQLLRWVRFERFLVQAEVVWSYQEKLVSIPLVIDGAQRRCHPDVLVVLADRRVVLAELKPRLQWALFDNMRKWAALANYCRQHGYRMFIGDCPTAPSRGPSPPPTSSVHP